MTFSKDEFENIIHNVTNTVLEKTGVLKKRKPYGYNMIYNKGWLVASMHGVVSLVSEQRIRAGGFKIILLMMGHMTSTNILKITVKQICDIAKMSETTVNRHIRDLESVHIIFKDRGISKRYWILDPNYAIRGRISQLQKDSETGHISFVKETGTI